MNLYQARIDIKVGRVRKRSFEKLSDRLTSVVRATEETRDAVVISSLNERSMSILIAVDASSSSMADSTVNRLVRGYMRALDAEPIPTKVSADRHRVMRRPRLVFPVIDQQVALVN